MFETLSVLIRKSKHWLYPYYFALTVSKRLTPVPIDTVYCQELPFSVLQGFAGEPISYFPPCIYYQRSLTQPTVAYNAFYEWLRMCLLDMEAWRIPKQEGGWAEGSLMRCVYQVHEEHGIVLQDFSEANLELVYEAIHRRTRYYFGVFESIRRRGFKCSLTPPITCQLRDQRYVLQNGHHRTAALYVLGNQSVFIKITK